MSTCNKFFDMNRSKHSVFHFGFVFRNDDDSRTIECTCMSVFVCLFEFYGKYLYSSSQMKNGCRKSNTREHMHWIVRVQERLKDFKDAENAETFAMEGSHIARLQPFLD